MFRLACLSTLCVVFGAPCGCATGSTRGGPLRLGVVWRSHGAIEGATPEDRLADRGCRHADLEGPGATVVRVSDLSPVDDRARPNDKPADVGDKTWHLDLAFRGSHTKLSETEQLLDRRLDLPLKLDVFGVFDHPTTPIDRKTNLQLMSFSVGIGREENDYLVWTVYGGGGAAANRNHQRFAILQLDVDFKYALAYVGFTTEVYPWRVPRKATGLTWERRLRASRPYFTAGFETGYVSGEGKGDYSAGPVTLYKDGVTIRDWTFSWPVGVGWTVPLSERWSFHLVGDYRFHLYRPDEYNGWNFTSALRRRF